MVTYAANLLWSGLRLRAETSGGEIVVSFLFSFLPVSTDRLCLSFLSVRKIKKSGFIDLIYPSFRSRPLIHIGVASGTEPFSELI